MTEDSEIAAIVSDGEFSSRQVAFNEKYEQLRSEQVARLKEVLDGHALLDLGAGKDGWRMAKFATDTLGTRKYVGIDFSGEVTKVADFRYQMRFGEKPDPEVIEFIESDMLTFLSKQPDNSAAITLNGIDDVIIDPKVAGNEKYLEALVREVVRVAGDDNVVFGFNSEDIFARLEKHGFKLDSSSDDKYGLRVYKKEDEVRV